MFKGPFFHCLTWMAFPILSFTLTACDGGGNGAPDADVSSTPTDSLTVHASAIGEVTPGLSVTLSAEVEEDGGDVRYRWSQTEGPEVNLEDPDQDTTRFRVPAVAEDTELGFAVEASDAAGHAGRYEVSVMIEALTWERLHVVEREITDQFVVFRADKDIDDRIDLYLATLDGETIVRLNDPPPVPGGDVQSFRISPDRQYVAYRADQEAVGVVELFAARTDGGGVSKVNGPLLAGGGVFEFAWSPDSENLAYQADQIEDNVFELFVSAPDGSGNVRVSGDLVLNGDVQFDFAWRPNGESIAYRADQNTDNVLELFVSSADGADNVRVSGPLVAGGDVQFDFVWSPDSEYLAYRADQLTDNAVELFTSTADGSENGRVSVPLVTNGFLRDFAWSPDSARIAYRGDVVFDDVFELFTVLADGSGNVRVSAVSGDGDVLFLGSRDYRWAPDSSAIAYLADQVDDNVFELFVSGPDGAGNRRVSGALVTDGDVFDFAWSPDSAHIAYQADQNTDNVFELFVSNPDGSSNLQVSGTQVTDGDVNRDYLWSPDSQWLAYRADQNVDNVFELFTTTPAGSPNVKVSGPMVFNGDVQSLSGASFLWAPDASRLVYAADQLEDGKYELFVAAPDGNALNDTLSGELTPGGDVFNFALE